MQSVFIIFTLTHLNKSFDFWQRIGLHALFRGSSSISQCSSRGNRKFVRRRRTRHRKAGRWPAKTKLRYRAARMQGGPGTRTALGSRCVEIFPTCCQTIPMETKLRSRFPADKYRACR